MQELVKSPKFQPIASIMKDPLLASRLATFIDNAVEAKGEIAKQNQLIKDTVKLACDELKVDPKLFRIYVAAAFNNDYGLRLQSLNTQVDLLERIIMTLPGGLDAYMPQLTNDDGE
jgi:hypothetical protein